LKRLNDKLNLHVGLTERERFNSMAFKIGQIVRLKRGRLSRGYRAKPGTKALVYKETYTQAWCIDPLIGVKWIDGKEQVDGGYQRKDFEPTLDKDEQMLFSFMMKD